MRALLVITHCHKTIQKKHFYLKINTPNDNKIYKSSSLKECVNFLENFNTKKNMHICVENLDELGFAFLEERWDLKAWGYDFLMHDMRFYNVQILKHQKKLVFWCLNKIWPSFRKEASSWNLKKPNDFEFKPLGVVSSDLDDELAGLCRIVIMGACLKHINNICEKYRINWPKTKFYSISGFAWKVFEKRFLRNYLKKPLKASIEEHVKDSYFGGRCEVFGNPLEGEYTQYWDYNGMYSLCMKEDFPVGGWFMSFEKTSIDEVGFYEIEFESKDADVPILPHKKERNQKLMFVNGRLRGVYWWEEVLLFMEEGGVVLKIHSALCFKKTKPIFKEFVEHVDEMKAQQPDLKKFYKMFINSFYGRMAIKKFETATAIISDFEEMCALLATQEVLNFTQVGSFWIVEYDLTYNNTGFKNFLKKDGGNFGIIYASIITSKARIKLYNLFKKIKNKGGRLLYCDTDSVYAAFAKPHDLVFENTKTNQTPIVDAIFIASKSYAVKYETHTEYVFKGFSNLNVKFDILKKKFYQNKINEIFSNESIRSKKNLKIEEKIVKKQLLPSSYDKRILSKDKSTSTPLTFYRGVYL